MAGIWEMRERAQVSSMLLALARQVSLSAVVAYTLVGCTTQNHSPSANKNSAHLTDKLVLDRQKITPTQVALNKNDRLYRVRSSKPKTSTPKPTTQIATLPAQQSVTASQTVSERLTTGSINKVSQKPVQLAVAPLPPTAPTVSPVATSKSGLPTRRSDPQSRFTAAPWQPWGSHVTADWSSRKALGHYAALQRKHPTMLADRTPMVLRVINPGFGNAPRYEVRIGQPNRAKAKEFCSKLRSLGGPCVIAKTEQRW